MYTKKLHISRIFTNLESSSFKLYNLVMCNLYTKFVSFLEICKKFSNGLVTDAGNFHRPGPVPRFSDLEIIALSMAAESEGLTVRCCCRSTDLASTVSLPSGTSAEWLPRNWLW
jgi:hypothetical protein